MDALTNNNMDAQTMNNSLKEQIINYLDLKEVDCYQSEEDLFCDHFDLVMDDDGYYHFDGQLFSHIDKVILHNDETMNVFVNIVNQVFDNYYADCFN